MIDPTSLIPLLSAFGGAIMATVYFMFFHSFADSFDKAFDKDALKLLNNEDKAKNKAPKPAKSKTDAALKAKKEARDLDIEKYFTRLANCELEPEYTVFIKSHLQNLAQQIVSLHASLKDSQQAKLNVDNKMEVHKNARVIAETKLADIKVEISELNKKYKEVSASEQELQGKVSSLEKKNTDLTSSLAKAMDDRSKLQTQHAKLSEDLGKLSSCTADLAEAEKKIIGLTATLGATVDESSKLKSQFTIMSEDVTTLTCQVSDLEDKLKKSTEANEVLEALTKQQTEEIASADTIKNELGVLRKQYDDALLNENAAKSSLEAECAKFAEDIAAAKKEREDLQKKWAEEKLAWKKEEDQFQNELSLTKALVEKLEAQVVQVEQMRSKLKELEKEIQERDEAIVALKNSSSTHSAELDVAMTERVQLLKDINSLKNDLAVQKEQMKAAASNTNACEEISALKDENKRLSDKNQELRERNAKVIEESEKNKVQLASNAKSEIRAELEHDRGAVIALLASYSQSPQGEITTEKFRSWLADVKSSMLSLSIKGAAGDSKLEMSNQNTSLVDASKFSDIALQLDIVAVAAKNERKEHATQINELKQKINALEIDVLKASVAVTKSLLE